MKSKPFVMWTDEASGRCIFLNLSQIKHASLGMDKDDLICTVSFEGQGETDTFTLHGALARLLSERLNERAMRLDGSLFPDPVQDKNA